MEFPWRCNVDTIAMDLKVSWEMSDNARSEDRSIHEIAARADTKTLDNSHAPLLAREANNLPSGVQCPCGTRQYSGLPFQKGKPRQGRD